MNIFNATHLNEPIPDGFDAVKIPLDGTLKSDLDWTKQRQWVEEHPEYHILWDLDLGLFSDLRSLRNQTQFKSLTLSINHFLESIWQQFHSRTLGVVLFQGTIHFENAIPWDEEEEQIFVEWQEEAPNPQKRLYCRDAIAEYLDLLVGRLPEALTPIILMDDDPGLTHSQRAQYLSKESFPHLETALNQPPDGYRWGSHRLCREPKPIPEAPLPTVGVCLPPDQSTPEELDSIFEDLEKKKVPFRTIPESMLTTEWHGIDDLIVLSSKVSGEGFRMLQGFCAAGGSVIYSGGSLELPQTQVYADWQKEH